MCPISSNKLVIMTQWRRNARARTKPCTMPLCTESFCFERHALQFHFFCCCLFFLLEFYASHIQTYTQNAMAKTIEMMRYAAICLQFDIKSRTLADFHAYLHRLIYFIRKWMFWLLIWKQFENGWCIPLNPLCVFRYKHKFRFWKEIHKTFSIRNLQFKKKRLPDSTYCEYFTCAEFHSLSKSR